MQPSSTGSGSILKQPASNSSAAKRWDAVGGKMRSDEKFYFYLAAAVFSISVVYTVFFQILPFFEDRHEYTYAHCTATGAGHWEKYGTMSGIEERVVVPVEVRIGSIQDALNWEANGTNIYRSRDVYHQGIARDTPQGWKYFTAQDKIDYLDQYKPGHEYECWARPDTHFHEVVFHRERSFSRVVPQIIFLVIIIGLCMATGVCLGIMDMGRALIGMSELDEEQGMQEVLIGRDSTRPVYGAALTQKGKDIQYA